MDGKCLICDDGKDYKILSQHIKLKHGLTMEEYEAQYLNVLEEVDEIPAVVEEPKIQITPAERIENIFGKEVSFVDKTVGELLEEYDLCEKELRALLRKYKTGSELPVTQQIEQKLKLGAEGAEALKNENTVKTTVLEEAEALTKFHNFTVVDVISAKGMQKKTWVLKKNT